MNIENIVMNMTQEQSKEALRLLIEQMPDLDLIEVINANIQGMARDELAECLNDPPPD